MKTEVQSLKVLLTTQINQTINQQKNSEIIIENLKKQIQQIEIQTQGTKQISIEKSQQEEWIRQENDEIKKMIDNMKRDHHEILKKGKEWNIKRKKAEEYVQHQKMIGEEMNVIKEQVNENRTSISYQSDAIR